MANDYTRDTAERSWMWWAIAIVVIAALLFFLIPAFTGDRATNLTQTDETANEAATGGVDPTPSIADILENPIALEGNTVTVTGEVERRAGARAFILDELGLVQDQILVITLDDQMVFEEDTQVAVIGVVRRGAAVDVEREFNIDLTREYEMEITNKPFIVASSVLTQ